MNMPVVAIVGRTNVGKSTLFNRVAESHKALISKIPGTTRDRNEADCFWQGTVARFIDTGGLDIKPNDPFAEQIEQQVALAMKQADVVLFVVDTQIGITDDDRTLAKRLLKLKQPVLLVANKADNAPLRSRATEKDWQALGFGTPMAISASQSVGVGDLLDEIWKILKKKKRPPVEVSDAVPTRVIVIGKPNVGKSSLLNSVLGEDRFITSAVAHTTREPNDTRVEIDGKTYILIDTAGILKQAKVKKRGGLEKSGVSKTLSMMNKSDVALFVLDVTADIGSQEKHLAGILKEKNIGVVTVANKWDLVADKTPTTMNTFRSYIEAHLPFMSWSPVIFTSALTGKKVAGVFKQIAEVQNERYKHIEEDDLTDFLERMVRKHKPSRGKGVAHPKILRIKQTGVAPPTFTLTVKGGRADVLHPSYLRFLENRLREHYGFEGTPIIVRAKAARARSK